MSKRPHRTEEIVTHLCGRSMHVLVPFIKECREAEADFGSNDPQVLAELHNLENLIVSTLQHMVEDRT